MKDPTVIATVKRMRDCVEYVLGKTLADLCNIGFYHVTSISHNESWYRHGSGEKVYF
jgi:hypothetical protein